MAARLRVGRPATRHAAAHAHPSRTWKKKDSPEKNDLASELRIPPSIRPATWRAAAKARLVRVCAGKAVQGLAVVVQAGSRETEGARTAARRQGAGRQAAGRKLLDRSAVCQDGGALRQRCGRKSASSRIN